MSEARGRVEVVRGHMNASVEEEITSFWTEQGLLTAESARERLPQVVCVLRDEDGAVAGVNSAYPGQVAMVGNRVFWVYRVALGPEGGDEEFLAMLSKCFGALAREFEEQRSGPVGVCLTIADTGFLERHPEAIWPEVGFLHAGFMQDGSQLRIRYFEEARI